MSSFHSRASGKHSGCFAALAIVLFSLSASILSAQDDNDPFSTEPLNWDKAALPLPYGFVAGIGGFVWGAQDDNADAALTYGLDFYHDAWQFGFHKEQWGNVFRLMTRSVGRDYVNYGFYLEYGWHPLDSFTVSYDDNGNSIPDSIVGRKAQTAIGGGFRYAVGYDDDFSITWGFELSAGTTHLRMAMPMGMRLPIRQYALRLELTPQVLGYTVGKGLRPADTELTGLFGVWLSGKFALNMER